MADPLPGDVEAPVSPGPVSPSAVTLHPALLSSDEESDAGPVETDAPAQRSIPSVPSTESAPGEKSTPLGAPEEGADSTGVDGESLLRARRGRWDEALL